MCSRRSRSVSIPREASRSAILGPTPGRDSIGRFPSSILLGLGTPWSMPAKPASVGRERELAALRSAYERVRDGGSCELVTVTGAPGIGKSRLVRELVGSVTEEARVVVGRCLSYGEGITYWPLAEILRQVAGSEPRRGLGELLGQEPEKELVVERLLSAVGSS